MDHFDGPEDDIGLESCVLFRNWNLGKLGIVHSSNFSWLLKLENVHYLMVFVVLPVCFCRDLGLLLRKCVEDNSVFLYV